MTRAALVAIGNAWRAAGRVVSRGPLLPRLAMLLMLAATLGIALLSAWGTAAVVRVAGLVLSQLPALSPMNLVERLLAGALGATFGLLLLGSLTTAVGTLFLSDELRALAVLPIPRGALLARQLAVTAAAASAPTLLVAVPAVLSASRFAPRPALAASSLLFVLFAFAAFASLLGAALALALVRFVPPRRARFAAAFLSAIGLSIALLGFRAARPERLLDPSAALDLLESIGTTPPSGTGPLAFSAHLSARALEGDPRALAGSAALAAAALFVCALAARLLAGVHARAWETASSASEPVSRRGRGRPASTLSRELWRAEMRTLLRDAATPAQLGTLSAVAALYLLNVRLLPTADPASRDLLLGLQTALALFLVGALALRFGYPALSSDGRAALVLRSLPLSTGRHLAVRWAARAFPAVLLALVLVSASAVALRPDVFSLARALVIAAAGALAIPALHVGLGALRPRYDAENPIAVALGPGGLLAMALATSLAILAAPAASHELTLFLSTVGGGRALGAGPPLAVWLLLAALAGVGSMALGAAHLRASEVACT